MANRTRIGACREMPARDQGIYGRHQIRSQGKLEQCRVIADSENDARFRARRIAAREKAPDQFKFTEIG